MILDLTSARSFASGYSDISDVQLDNLFDDLSTEGADKMEVIVGTIADTLRAVSKARSPARLLERRFSALPQAAGDRASRADLNQLDLQIDQVLDA